MNTPLIGQLAPVFKSKAIVDGQIALDFTLQDFLGQYVLFFFYPLDFTFVCPTELHAFQEELDAFEERNCQVIACSVDSIYSHLAWLNTPKSQGGVQGIQYPLVSDLQKNIASACNVLKEDGVAYRAQFLIDRKGIIRHMLINDLPIGRSVDEALRTLDALIHHESYGDVCPANWTKGNKAMSADQEGVIDYFQDQLS
jgi:peroxiredoxin (alkyl hydroperoxide reductase subunit C)